MKKIVLLSLICLSLIVYLGKSYETTIGSIDAEIYSYSALDMTRQGMTPKLPPELLNINQHIYVFNDSPFPQLYLEGWIMRALGANAWSSKLLSAFFSVGCVLLTIWLGTLLVHFEFGCFAGIILLFSRHFIMWNANFHLDAGMIFFILLSAVFWVKQKWISFGLAIGFGLWMKTPAALLMLPVSFIVSLLRGSLKKDFKNIAISTIIALLVGSVVWGLTALFSDISVVKDYWTRQIYRTAVLGRGVGNSDYLTFWKDLRVFYLPWNFFLLFAVFKIIKEKAWKQPVILNSAVAVLVLYLVISTIRFRYWYYYLPAYPFLALISAYSLKDFLLRHQHRFHIFVICFTMLTSTVLLATPISLGPEKLPALAKFTSFIQSVGECEDEILLIRGHEPYGGDINFMYYLNLYTYRKVVLANCDEAEEKLSNPKIKWVIAAGENTKNCFSRPKEFSSRLKFGNKLLYSKYPLFDQGVFNLEPLLREGKAPIDCKPVPIESSFFFKKDDSIR